MAKFDKSLRGKCKFMCPEEEIKMREREHLLHVLEMVPGTRKASKRHAVKCFTRSAAGKQIKEESVRPPDVLLKTVRYLLCEVIITKKLPWHSVYDFITDRLMAVRQDMVVQDLSAAESITILQPIVRFHAFAAYKLCGQTITNFDPALNNNHLQECLKKLLCFYDKCESLLLVGNSMCNNYILGTRPEFESLYLLFNLGNGEALQRALTIPCHYKTGIVKKSMQISLCYRRDNFVTVCRLVKNLPTLLAAVASLHLPEIRRKAFQVMSVAYHSKNLSFPTKVLQEILLYGNASDLLDDCKRYGLQCDSRSISFTKQSFDQTQKTVTPRHEYFIDGKFDDDIPTVILGL